MKNLIKMLEYLKLKLIVLQLQLRVLLLKEKRTIPNLPKPKYVVVHHAASSASFLSVNEYHRQRWGMKSSLGFFCGYHKFISYAGRLYIARRDREEGAHCVEPGNPGFWNKNSVGICLQGNTELEEPTPNQLTTLNRELNAYELNGSKIKSHREIVQTLCPGEKLVKFLKGRYIN